MVKRSPAEGEPRPVDPESLVGKTFSGRVFVSATLMTGRTHEERYWLLAGDILPEQREIEASLISAERQGSYVRFQLGTPFAFETHPRHDYLLVAGSELNDFARSVEE